MMTAAPRRISRVAGRGLGILWADGKDSFIGNRRLRENCPCAHCAEARGEMSHDQPLGGKKRSLLTVVKHTADEETDLREVRGIGNYAISISWGDGHNSGIYSFELLRKLCTI